MVLFYCRVLPAVFILVLLIIYTVEKKKEWLPLLPVILQSVHNVM